jgi:hypothetical protein
MAQTFANGAGARHPISGNSIVFPAKAGIHTPQRLLLSTQVDSFFQQQTTWILGPGLRRDDV